MISMITKITDRGQASVPALVRKKLNLKPGTQIVWEPVSDREVRVLVKATNKPPGPMAVLGYANTFRKTKRTQDWIHELRAGEMEL